MRVYDFDGDAVITIDRATWFALPGADRRRFRRDSMWLAARKSGRVRCVGSGLGCSCRICTTEASL